MQAATLDDVKFDDKGLVPVLVQHARTGEMRMQGFANREALSRTLSEGVVWFFSRSRDELWKKGETSGNVLHVVEVQVDCDGDSVLVRALPDGPTCHTGAPACFFRRLPAENNQTAASSLVLAELEAIIADRKENPKPGSYTNALLSGGVEAIGAKIREEAEEVIIAADKEGKVRTASEAADVLYHLAVLLAHVGVTVDDVASELANRRK